MKPSSNESLTIDCLKHVIEDSQNTIRGYDSKAEIMAILLTLAIGFTNFTLFPEVSGISKYLLIFSWVISFLAIGMLGLVLYPKKNQFQKINMGNYTPKGTYFIHSVADTPECTVSAMAEKALNTNWVLELTYESMKLSVIRKRKHFWFIRALRLSGLTLLLIVTTLVLGVSRGNYIS